MADKNIEVEVKARLDDPAPVEERLLSMAVLLDRIDHRDTYFTYAHLPGYTSQRFRLRRSKGRARVTIKQDLASEGVEASLESDFEVDDPEAFERFALLFGFRVLVQKRKQGRRYLVEDAACPPGLERAVVELVEVEGLGKFIEIEIMVEQPSQVSAARQRISRIMAALGVSASQVEPRPYTAMLHELKEGKGL